MSRQIPAIWVTPLKMRVSSLCASGTACDDLFHDPERACQWFLDTILLGLKDIPYSCRQLLAAVASCFRCDL